MAKKVNPLKFFNDQSDERLKKMQEGGSIDLKNAVSDSTRADKDYFYAKQYPKDFSGNGSKLKYIEDLQTKMEAPGKIRKQTNNSKNK